MEIQNILNDMCGVGEDKDYILKMFKKLEEENKRLKEKNLNLEKQNNTRKDIIYNLFSQQVNNQNALDDGIDITKEYGQKYIDEWNAIHKEIYEDVVETMNKCELEGLHIEYNGCSHFDICVNESSDEEEE
jgi:hypothetical protein